MSQSNAPAPAIVSSRLGVLALLATTMIWGTTFPSMKMLEGSLAPLHIALLRAGLASAVLLLPIVCLPRARGMRRQEWCWGLGLGGVSFVAFWLQVSGLMLTTSNRNAFLTGLTVLIVPLLAWLVLRQRPGWRLWAACGMALLGMALMFFEGAPWNRGDTLTLGSALCYAIYILLLDICARRNAAAPLRATHLTLAMSVGMTLAACLALVAEPGGWSITLRYVAALPAPGWWAIGYLVVFASVLAIVLQAWGQQRVDAMRSAIIYGLEPVFAALAAWVLIGERLGLPALAGAALIVAGMVLSQWQPAPPPAAGPTP